MKTTLSYALLFTLSISVFSGYAIASSRVNDIVEQDVTERLETIQTLKKSMRDMKVQLSVLNTALEEAKKKKSHKKIYGDTKKVADALTALTILGGALSAYAFKDEVRVIKIASLIGGISGSVSVLAGLASDLSTDEAEAVQAKISELNGLIKATELNLGKEVKSLCDSEPSNQMCR
jgi:hypothetical protein